VLDAFPSAVIVRPSVMCGQGDAFISAVVSSARRLPLYPLFGRGDTRLQPVHVDDVALACAELLAMTNGEDLYEFGGPRILTYRKLVGEIADAYALRVRMVPVPYPIWRLLAAAAVLSRHAPITPAQVALMEKDNIVSSTAPGLRSLGIDAREILSTIARGSF
jgi:NADH dehydrogenase